MVESREANFDQAENDLIVLKVEKFLRDGCGCSRGIKGGQCSQQFSLGSCAGECKQLLWTLSCRAWFSRIGEHSSLHWLWATGKERQRSSQCNFLFQSLPICKEMFLHLYAMSYSRFLWLKKHYENHNECMEMARDCLKNTPPHAMVEDVTNLLMCFYLEGFLVSRTTTSNFFLPVKLKWATGILSKHHAKQ